MLKKFLTKKIIIASLVMFAMGLLYLIPETNNYEHNLDTTNVEYVYTNTKSVLYLLDSNNYVARVTVDGIDSSDTKEIIKNAINSLVVDGEASDKIPNGFREILPAGTQVKDLNLENKLLTINFSKELLDINSDYEEAMIESLVYTITSIEGIDKLKILVEGVPLSNLPNSKKKLPEVFDKSYGINKNYDLLKTNDIESYTIYYVSNYNDYEYYVPVTKYVNSNGEDKVKVIIDELSTSPIYEDNLVSYLNTNANLIDYSLDNDIMKLNFSNNILDNSTSNQILEEVIYTISLSIENNFDVKEVIFFVDNKEFYRNSLNSIE